MSYSVELLSYLVTNSVRQAIVEFIIWSFGKWVSQLKIQKIGKFCHCLIQGKDKSWELFISLEMFDVVFCYVAN